MLDNQGSLSVDSESGAGGSIEISTNTLKINQGIINASVFGSGTGGNIEIEARDSVEIIGSSTAQSQQNPNDLATPNSDSLRNEDLIIYQS